MNFIIDAEQMNNENLLKASVYLDACFILAYLDKTDARSLDVADALDIWAENEVRLGYSNHTFTEVTNRLFQMLVLGSLQVYHEKKQLLNNTRNGFDKLSDEDRVKLINLDSARYLYRVAKDEEILRFYNKKVAANVGELIKKAMRPKLICKASSTFSIISSSRCVILSVRRCLSIVLICSSSMTESRSKP